MYWEYSEYLPTIQLASKHTMCAALMAVIPIITVRKTSVAFLHIFADLLSYKR